jgi:hypothetical protein
VQVDYSIYRNGKFLHRASTDGGQITGCWYGKLDPSQKIVFPLEWKQVTYGWMIKILGVCGNTSSERVVLVVIPESPVEGYFTKTIETKANPVLRNFGADLAVWYVYQEWGDGGTASSFFVPGALKISLSAPDSSFASLPMPAKAEEWPTFEGFPYTLASIVAAGLNSLNPALIREAAVRFSAKDAEQLKEVGLPETKQGLGLLASALEADGSYLRKFYHGN